MILCTRMLQHCMDNWSRDDCAAPGCTATGTTAGAAPSHWNSKGFVTQFVLINTNGSLKNIHQKSHRFCDFSEAPLTAVHVARWLLLHLPRNCGHTPNVLLSEQHWKKSFKRPSFTRHWWESWWYKEINYPPTSWGHAEIQEQSKNITAGLLQQ